MKAKYVYVCLLSIALMWAALEISGYRKTHATGTALTDAQQGNKQHSQAGPVRNVRFTLFEEGIRPTEMRINAGLVNISIEDKTSDGNGLLIQRVDAGHKNAVGNVRNMQDQTRGRSQLRFTPGTYELQDAVRPDNKAVLIVEP